MSNLSEILSSLKIKTSPEQLEQLSALVEPKKEKKVIAHKWAVVEGAQFGAKVPLQMRQAVLSITGKGEVDMKTWSESLAKYEGFKTQQPVERIIAFYKKRMIDEGLIRAIA